MVTETIKFIDVRNEREFLEQRVAGASFRVNLGDETSTWAMVYEGTINGKESFIDRNPEEPNIILNWRSPLDKLTFESSLPEGNGHGLIRFNELYRELVIYKEGESKYDQAAAMLINAGLWGNE